MSTDERIAQAKAQLSEIIAATQEGFRTEKRVLSYNEYLERFAADPAGLSRDASAYVRDVFLAYGTSEVESPAGQTRRFSLFDLPWEEDPAVRAEALVGQEGVQNEIFRVLSNFVREGRPNRLLLLHGPNGSAKSTVMRCIFRALEHYSQQEHGALYRFHWVFPTRTKTQGSIGFGSGPVSTRSDTESFAHLDESEIDARLAIEVRDHPLFLLPIGPRRTLLDKLFSSVGKDESPPQWICRGRLSHKNQQVFDALLAAYKGDLAQVLRHVQVERYFISHRYRIGAATIGPQLSVDAGERQLTADRSLAALPTSLQATTLFEAHGELVDSHGGMLEFSDLLKRPLDAFKYLQQVVETGEVALQQQTLMLNTVLAATANEVHLAAFREHPEYPSFRGRLELIRVPYLRNWSNEADIYRSQIVPHLTCEVAPYAVEFAAKFAVLTRLRKPNKEAYPKAVAELVDGLTAMEKLRIYTDCTPPARLSSDDRKLLATHLPALLAETQSEILYEGLVGASPRLMRAVLLNAAQDQRFAYVSPMAVVDELRRTLKRKNEFAWLKQEKAEGGYYDFEVLLGALQEQVIDAWEEDMRIASGMVEESVYANLLSRYIEHVSMWTKNEKVYNKLTGKYEEPDQVLFAEVEALLGVEKDKAEGFRRGAISAVAAWAIDHPGQEVQAERVFPAYLKKMRAAVFEERRQALGKLVGDILVHLREGEDANLEPARAAEVAKAVANLRKRGYPEGAVGEAAAALISSRFAD